MFGYQWVNNDIYCIKNIIERIGKVGERIVEIYKIVNKENGFVYIGQTAVGIKERFKQHLKNTRDKDKMHSLFYKDLREMGKDSFDIKVIDTCFDRHKFIVEEYWTEYYRGKGYPMYNINSGATLSKNTKQRLTELRRQREFDYQSEQFKQKMSEVTRGENNGMYGRKGENAVNGRMVIAYDENNNVQHKFISVQEALKFIGIKGHTGLNKACRTGELYHGYYWKKEWIDR